MFRENAKTEGALLRLYRERAGMTQAQAAALAGVTQQALSLIESGRCLAKSGTRAAICEALGIPEGFLALPAVEVSRP